MREPSPDGDAERRRCAPRAARAGLHALGRSRLERSAAALPTNQHHRHNTCHPHLHCTGPLRASGGGSRREVLAGWEGQRADVWRRAGGLASLGLASRPRASRRQIDGAGAGGGCLCLDQQIPCPSFILNTNFIPSLIEDRSLIRACSPAKRRAREQTNTLFGLACHHHSARSPSPPTIALCSIIKQLCIASSNLHRRT